MYAHFCLSHSFFFFLLLFSWISHYSGFPFDNFLTFFFPSVWLAFLVPVEKCMSSMQMGTQMVKLRGGSKGLVRFFYLDEHKSCIRWRPSRKNEKAKSKCLPSYSHEGTAFQICVFPCSCSSKYSWFTCIENHVCHIVCDRQGSLNATRQTFPF